LLLHNNQLADPLNRISKDIKQISSKRKKTDADYLEMGHLEFLGSFYLNKKGEPVIPARVVKGVLKRGAKKVSEKPRVEEGIIVDEDFPIIYNGPKDIERLWEQRDKFALMAPVKIGKSTVTRTRPKFEEWQLLVSIDYDPDVLNAEDIDRYFIKAPGFGDWIPEYGRFSFKKV
jgi:hypothetical protein